MTADWIQGQFFCGREFRADRDAKSLTDLRNRMIAEGIELIAEAVAGLDRGALTSNPQTDRERTGNFRDA